MPVMVYIHGNGFFAGSSTSELYGPEYILDFNVVLVVINYRLGPLGKLSKYVIDNSVATISVIRVRILKVGYSNLLQFRYNVVAQI